MNRLKQFLIPRLVIIYLLINGIFIHTGICPGIATAAEKYIVTRTSLQTQRIDGLRWSAGELKVQYRRSHDKQESYVVLKGKYAKQAYDLYADNRVVTRDATGIFEIKVAFKLKPVLLNLRAVGPLGVLETETVLLLSIPKPIPS